MPWNALAGLEVNADISHAMVNIYGANTHTYTGKMILDQLQYQPIFLRSDNFNADIKNFKHPLSVVFIINNKNVHIYMTVLCTEKSITCQNKLRDLS